MHLYRWTGFALSLAALLLLAAGAVAREKADPKEDAPAKYWVFVGTYTGPKTKSKGIYRLEMDAATGALSEAEVAAETPNPSFLAIHPTQQYLYAVGESGDFGFKKAGAVSSFSLDPTNGKIEFLNRQSTTGAGPCHVIVDSRGKFVLVANYGGGNEVVLPVIDGKLQPVFAYAKQLGKSINKARQSEAHAHSINLDKANRFVFIADLGIDQILIYQYDRDTGGLTTHDPQSIHVEPGSGPRHFAFHPDGKHAYVINELANTITVFDYDAENGNLTTKQTVPTLPRTFRGESSTAEIVVHPSGKFLYGSNRGHNSIAVFLVDPKSGKLIPTGFQTKDIKTPRNFNIDPSGKFLVVANQDSDSLVVFAIDPRTGALTPTGHKAKVPTPVCVKFVPKG
jgi:6-phosphogluconolactonase